MQIHFFVFASFPSKFPRHSHRGHFRYCLGRALQISERSVIIQCAWQIDFAEAFELNLYVDCFAGGAISSKRHQMFERTTVLRYVHGYVSRIMCVCVCCGNASTQRNDNLRDAATARVRSENKIFMLNAKNQPMERAVERGRERTECQLQARTRWQLNRLRLTTLLLYDSTHIILGYAVWMVLAKCLLGVINFLLRTRTKSFRCVYAAVARAARFDELIHRARLTQCAYGVFCSHLCLLFFVGVNRWCRQW